MRWWLTVLVVAAILWWLAHRHLARRVAKLAMRGALGKAGGCGCGNASLTGTVGTSITSSVGNGSSQTSGGLQVSPAPVGSLPSSVGNGGPNPLPKWDPNGGLWQ